MSSSVMDTTAEGIAAADAAARAAAALPEPLSSRPDNRLPTELRPISVEQGLLNRADGSVQWTQGGSSVLVGIYGPVILGGKDEKIDRATVVVNFKAASGQANNIDIERGSYIRQCFEPLLLLAVAPRAKIQIHVQVLRDGGSVLSCALNAVSLALIDAGVQATAVLSAVCVAAPQGERVDGTSDASADGAEPSYLLDPVSTEEAVCPTMTLACASTSAGVLLSVVERGAFGKSAYTDATLIGKAACAHVLQFMRLSLERKHTTA